MADPFAPEVLDALAHGRPVVLATDTVYGLCALPGVEGAVGRLFDVKGRDASTPIAVLCADAGQALSLAADPSDAHRAVAGACWPGALTLVLRRAPHVDWPLGEPVDTIGLRCPDDAALAWLTAQLGPVAATSANRHGEPVVTTAAEARRQLGPEVLVVDGGPRGDVASTVVDATGTKWHILREGSVHRQDLARAGAPLE